MAAEIEAVPPPARRSRRKAGSLSANVLGHRVAEAIRADILAGRLPPGGRIRQEDIARQYGVSRIPVREALKQLHSDGLVALRANSGAWVAKLDLAQVDEIYRIRERLEPLALRDSVRSLSDTAVARLERLREEMIACADVETFLRLDHEFHALTYTGSSMRTLREMIERFWNGTQHYRRMFQSKASAETMWLVHAEHRLLVEAIKRRDEDEAELILLGHIRRTRIELTQKVLAED